MTVIVTTVAVSLLVLPLKGPSGGIDLSLLKHLIGFCGLTGWFCGIMSRQRWPLVIVAMVLLAGSSEIVQWLTNFGRVGDWMDLLANFCGIALGLFLSLRGFEHWATCTDRFMVQFR